jgi:hypothetical protein
MRGLTIWVLTMGLVYASVTPLRAQAERSSDPLYGQSQDQEARDHWECHKQAVEQTGYDPSAPQNPTRPSTLSRATAQGKAVTGSTVKEAAGGAAVGAAVGAVTGNAGRGAAMGAAGGGMSGLLGGLAEVWGGSDDSPAQPPWQAYQQALSACMNVRGHSGK